MPFADLRRGKLAYEIVGSGPLVVWSPGGWFPRNDYTAIYAERMSPDHSVLLWDRRNSGQSEIAFDDSPSELHMWADDLHELLALVGRGPAVVGGGSMGAVFSLLFAHRYPADVHALALSGIPSDDVALIGGLAEERYFGPAKVAEARGMTGLIEEYREVRTMIGGWIAELLDASDQNESAIAGLQAEHYVRTLRRWGDWLSNDTTYRAHLSDGELGALKVPVLVTPGIDKMHPPGTSRELASHLSEVELVNWNEEELARLESADIPQRLDVILPITSASSPPWPKTGQSEHACERRRRRTPEERDYPDALTNRRHSTRAPWKLSR